MLGIHQHHIDFEILPTKNSKIILFLDASDYFEYPESPKVLISLPGFNKYFEAHIEANTLNVLNSNTVGLTKFIKSDCLTTFPDGIYTFVYMVCPYDFYTKTRYYLRTTELDKSIATIYSKNDILECDYKKTMIDVHLLLESARGNAELGFIERAQKDFILAQKMVNRILDKCNNC